MSNLVKLGQQAFNHFSRSLTRFETRTPSLIKLYSTNHQKESKDSTEQSTTGNKNDEQQSNAQPNSEQELSEIEKRLTEENEKLTEKVKIIDDNFKRALADSENFRIRKNKEIDDTKKFAIQSFAKDLLEVSDILQMAIQSVPKDELKSNQPLKSLFEGVTMTEKQLQTIFRRHGIVQINPIGEKFNPNEHDALCYVEDKTKIADTVFVVNKIGYKLKDRVIRAASVGVVKSN